LATWWITCSSPTESSRRGTCGGSDGMCAPDRLAGLETCAGHDGVGGAWQIPLRGCGLRRQDGISLAPWRILIEDFSIEPRVFGRSPPAAESGEVWTKLHNEERNEMAIDVLIEPAKLVAVCQRAREFAGKCVVAPPVWLLDPCRDLGVTSLPAQHHLEPATADQRWVNDEDRKRAGCRPRRRTYSHSRVRGGNQLQLADGPQSALAPPH
jgi:hypothetical protein